MLKYALYKSNLPQNVDKYVAITQQDETATLDDLISDMTSRGSTITRAEAMSNCEEFFTALKNRLSRGQRINILGIFEIGLDIQGNFDSADDQFKLNRNTVVVNFNAGDFLKEVAAKIILQKVEPSKVVPIIKETIDFATNAKDKFTKGNTGRISGLNLKVDTTDASQGVFLIPINGGSETQINAFLDNQPSMLTFQIPAALAADTYRLEVRVKINKTKELRVTALPGTIAIV